MCFAEFMEVVEVKEVMEVILHIVHYLYVATKTFNSHHWLDSSFSSTLASKLGGPRDLWRSWRSFQYLYMRLRTYMLIYIDA